MTIFLREIQSNPLHASDTFPFIVPVIQTLKTLEFTKSVTFLVGENGSGKSTLLESIAVAVGSITVGEISIERDTTLTDIRKYAQSLKLIWQTRTRKGFFMRSEDFFGYVKQQARLKEEMKKDLEDIDRDYKGRSEFAKNQAKMAFSGQLHAMKSRYGESLDAYSHGESYFTLFKARFVPGGLYLLDEPEAPLSPMRQLAFLTMLNDMIKRNSQVIIATHSPIIMAYPDAEILLCENGKIASVAYDDLEHVTITRSFLNDPQAYLRHLLE